MIASTAQEYHRERIIVMTFEEALGDLMEKYGAEEFTWQFIPFSQSEGAFVQELSSEIAERHPLYSRGIRYAIAKCQANDDVLFLSEDDHYFIVHLTYSKTNSSGYPRYIEFPDLEAAMSHIEEQYLFSL
jgi:hypothetical protein